MVFELEPTSELLFGQRVLSQVAASTSGQDVRDPSGTATRQRDPVVCVKLAVAAAIRAPSSPRSNEVEPFPCRKGAHRGGLARPTSKLRYPPDVGMAARPSADLGTQAITVGCVMAPAIGKVLVPVAHPPPPDPFNGKLTVAIGVASDPLTLVRALARRVLEGHLYLLRYGPPRMLNRSPSYASSSPPSRSNSVTVPAPR